MLDLVLRAYRAVVDGEERPCAVGVEGGRVAVVAELGADLEARQTVELADDEVLLPGLVDTHVHVDDPGRADWEGFEHATRAAAAGGVTTLVDMPLNSSPPTTTVEGLDLKRRAAEGRCHVDVAFWGGAVPGNGHDLQAMWDAGVLGFKCFLADSGVEEFPPLDEAGLLEAATTVAAFGGLLLVHAEDGDALADAPPGRSYAAFESTRPATAEVAAVRAVVEASRSTGCRMHVVHLAAGTALPLLRDAHDHGVPVTAETCPHYLAIATEDVPDGATAYKCCPPIRDRSQQDLLWAGLADGTLGMVVSDHSPAPAELKALDTGDLGTAWGGISSLQLGLPVVWTAARERGHDLVAVARWMAAGPADRAGLHHKGRIVEGADADLCVVAPDDSFDVDPEALHHRHPVTPYAGRTLHGVVRQTWLRGRQVDPADPSATPRGRLLRRGERP